VPRPAAAILSFYRADSWPRIRRVLLVGPTILTFGGLVVAVSFLTRQPRDVRTAAAALGFVLVAGGAIFTVLGMQRILRDEVYVILRSDGVVLQQHAGRGAGETLVAWDDLERARWDAGRAALVLERKHGEPVVVARAFARIRGPDLAAQIEQSRRRAAMGFLA
jgi:hypothetical protein